MTVSGLAYGIDTLVAESTILAGGKTIAVLAGGLDSIYPASNTNLAKKIEKDAFLSCDKLSLIRVYGTKDDWDKLKIFIPSNPKIEFIPPIITDEKLNKIEMQLLKYARVITEQSSIIDEQSLVLDRHEEMLQELMYTPIAISNLSLSQSLVEIGGSVVGLRINWNANKPPITAYINGEEIGSSENNYIYPYEITQDKTFTLKVTDDRGSAERSVSIKFANGKYYGTAQEGTYDSDFILSLNKEIVTNGKGNITVNCDNGQYVYYAIPTRFDTPRFSVGGFVGGFVLVDTIAFTNIYGYTEDYEIWKSENSNLGLVTINVG